MYNILIVDDEKIERSGIRMLLKRMGNKPNLQRGIHPEDYPYSFSNEIKKK